MKKTLFAFIFGFLALEAGATETWSVKTPMPNVRIGCGAVCVDSTIYVIGGGDNAGNPTNTVFAYNYYTDTWTTKASMPTARLVGHIATVGGKIYAIGGFDPSSGALAVVEEYNISTNSWSTKTPMPTARSQFSGAVLAGKIYVCGGWIGSYTQLEVYDPSTDTWTTKAPMHHGKIEESGGAALGGKYYFMGGKNYTNTTFYDSCLVYDPGIDSWTTGPNMPFARYGGGVTYIKGRIYFMCGSNGGPAIPNFNTNIYLDSATNSWRSSLACINRRTSCAAVATGNGRIYLLGGSDSTGAPVSWNHEYYNDTLIPTPSFVGTSPSATLEISPNPCSSKSLTVKLPSSKRPGITLNIINMVGQVSLSKCIVDTDKAVIDVSNLLPGLYTVVINSNEKVYSNTLIIEHN